MAGPANHREGDHAGAVNGDRRGTSWGNGGGWNDNTPDAYPDTLEVQFGQARTIDEINRELSG